MDQKKLDDVAAIAGYANFVELFVKFMFPVINGGFILALVIIFLIPQIPMWVGLMLIPVSMSIAFMYPVLKYEKVRKDINAHLLMFITYAGTISTMKISRLLLFQKVAEGKAFGTISDLFEKILYIAKKWTLGYSKGCRQIGKSCPSPILEDFLDRLAITMDFGEELEFFLQQEQKAVFEDYAVDYNKSLETIKMLQEMFVSLSVSGAFAIGILLLAPLMMGLELERALLYAGIGFILFDVLMMYLVNLFIPYDPLFHEYRKENEAQKKIFLTFWIALGLFPVIFVVATAFFNMEFILSFFISAIPFAIPGVLAQQEENKVMLRERNFCVYIKVLGSSIEVRNGGVVSALHETQVHDFGILNPNSIALYRRLKLGNDKYKCWDLFGLESGSNLIYHYTRIFSQSVGMGGNARVIGEIISVNMQSLLSLRKLRYQIKDGLRAAFYGSLFGFCATVFVTWTISKVMVKAFQVESIAGSELSNFVGSIIPQTEVNFAFVMTILLVISLVHSAFTSLIPKLIDGGSIFASVVDFLFMLLIVILLYLTLPPLVQNMLPDFGTVWGGA